VVGASPPPASSKRWRFGLYWVYVGLLSLVSIFFLAVASPIIRPTLPTNPAHLLFCIFAGIAIADAAAHAIADIAGIWKPHDLGGAAAPRKKFNARRFLLADIRDLLSHLTAVPLVALMAWSYTLLPPHIEDRLFGAEAAQGFVFWNFMSQSVMGGLDVFAFFLSQEAKTTLQQSLSLSELQPKSFEAAMILGGLKLYGLLIFVATLRLVGAPVVLVRTWVQSRRKKRKAK
jgi:hypothetical protein